MEIVEKKIEKVVRYIEYNGYRFYPDKRGYWIGEVENRRFVRLHIYVWEKERGAIPPGYQVHHKDHNPDNNEIDNLELLTKTEHLKYHASLQDKEWARRNINEKARPKAIEWHKSKAGREWHVKHGYEVMEKVLQVTEERTCQFCGKTYTVPSFCAEGSRFCSNNCKAAWRRKSGIDNAELECLYCGKKFFTNKYARAKYCSDECRTAIREQRKAERKSRSDNSVTTA